MVYKRPVFYFTAVALMALAVFFVERPTEQKQGDIIAKPLYENLDTKTASRIEIEQLLNGVQLKKEKDQWMVAEMKTGLKGKLEEGEKKDQRPEETVQWQPADNKKVDLTLQTLVDLDITSLAGNNPERFGFFEVNVVGMQVRVFDAAGKKLVHLYIGKTGPAFTESYVRKEGEDAVYIANRYLRSSFSPVTDDWKEKKAN